MCAAEMSRYFRRPPSRGWKAEAAEQDRIDALVQQVLDRQKARLG